MKGLAPVAAAWVLCTAGCGAATLPLSDDAGVAAPGDGGVTVERDGEGVAMITGTAGNDPRADGLNDLLGRPRGVRTPGQPIQNTEKRSPESNQLGGSVTPL